MSKPVVRRVISVLAALAMLVALIWVTRSVSAQTKERAKPTATATQSMATMPLFSVQVVQLKPDMLTEWQEFQKSEAIPTLQKGGIKERAVYQPAPFGHAFEYWLVTPITNFAQYDDPAASPIVKALGQDGARAYGAKIRRLIASSRTYAVRQRADLSYTANPDVMLPIGVISWYSVAPGRRPDFENYLRNDLLPVLKQGQTPGFGVFQALFGGDGNEMVTITSYNTYADIDKGPPMVRVLGPEGAAKLEAKLTGIVTHVERTISRYVPDLSFKVKTTTEAR